MKMKHVIPAIALSAGLIAFTGCNKEESKSTTTDIKDAASTAADEMKAAGEAVKEGTEKAAAEVKEKAESMVDSAKEKAQVIIDKAKSLVTEGKYKDALSSLDGLANFKLTPEQQKVVDDLKAQIQKALAAAKDGASAVGNMMGGSK